MSTTRILVVEDELIVARDICQQLAALGYEPVGTAARGDEALTLAAQHRPALVLMDIQLDGPIDGIEAAKTIRDLYSIPVIFLTAFASESVLARAKVAGPFGYIVKPFAERELRMSIEVALNLHETEARLHRSETQTRLLTRAVEQSPASILITNIAGRIEYVNPHFTKVTGYSAEEAIGRTPKIFNSGMHSRDFYAHLWETLLSGGEWTGEFHNRKKSGELFWERASVAAVRDRDGQITHFVAVKEDITAEKSAEDLLLQAKAELQESNARLVVTAAQAQELAKAAEAANQAKSAFLATMSHELRTPLNVINGASATLLEQNPSESQRAALNLIHQSGENLLGIIEEILDFTGLQAGRTALDTQLCDVSTVVFHALRQAIERGGGKGIDVRCQISPNVPARVLTDARKLRQVITNLLSNAVKFTEYGHVELRIDAHRVQDGRWELEFLVHDTGIGIEPDSLVRLFQPFAQADGSITRRYGGSGLGLAISRSLALLMGGDVTAQSRAGEGSLFRFTMLAGSSADSPSLVAAGRNPALEGKRALIAVSHPSHGSYFETVLGSWGLHCGVVDQGTVLPGVHGPGSAFDVLVIEAEALPPGLRSRWDSLHIGDDSPPVVWISRERYETSTSATQRSRTLTWPVAPDELQRTLLSLIGSNGEAAASADTPIAKVKGALGQRLPLRILAADDVRINREVLRMMLKHLGYVPDFVENGAEVLDALKRQNYDLVLLDVQMPVMDGLTAAREIGRMFPDRNTRPRLVAITANALPDARKDCLDAGMDDYLSKPVVPRQLVDCFLRLFERPIPAAEPPCPASSLLTIPWIDVSHLDAITDGQAPGDIHALVTQLVASFEEDFRSLLPRLRHACADRDVKPAILLVHGLKGGASTLGWARFSELCVQTLAALREGTFSAWASLPADLENAFAHSRGAADEMLANPELHIGADSVHA